MDQVTLNTDHGKHRSGTVFDVVKVAGSTTIVTGSGGRRVILPNSKLDGLPTSTTPKPAVATVELTEDQEHARQRMKSGMDLDDLVKLYVKATGLSVEDAKKDIVFIDEHMGKGSKFVTLTPPTAPGTPKSTPVVGASMSDIERKTLEELLGGDSTKWESPELGVSGDTEESEEEEQPELGPNQVWFTDITDGRLPETGINHMITLYSEDHWDKEHRIHIPKIDPNHYWDCEVLECLVLAHQLREKALITGLPGTGKSSSVKQFAAWVRQPYMRLGGRGDLESSSFLGYSWSEPVEIEGEMIASMIFKAGMLTQGLQWGYLVTIDEVMKIPSYIQMSMQHLYEKDGFLTIDDKPGTQEDKIVKPIKEFMMVLTDNVKGTGDNFDKFSATQMQDGSTLDRISLNETVDYLSPKQECLMLSKMFPKANSTTVSKLVKFAGLVRNGYKQGSIALTLSPRGLIAVLDMGNVGIPVLRALKLAYTNKIADETELIAIQDMIKTVAL